MRKAFQIREGMDQEKPGSFVSRLHIRPSPAYRDAPQEIPLSVGDRYDLPGHRVILAGPDSAEQEIRLSPAFLGYMREWHDRTPAMLNTGIPCLPTVEDQPDGLDYDQFRDYYKALSGEEEHAELAAVASALLDKVDMLDLPDGMRQQLYSGIGRTHDARDMHKADFVIDLMQAANLKGEFAAEVLKGAHVAIKDGGRLQRVLVNNRSTDDVISIAGVPICGRKSLRKRGSSHHWEEKIRGAAPFLEISFQAPHVFPEVMVGKRKNNCYSWFQLEKSPLAAVGPRIMPALPSLRGHFDDYKAYKELGRNIGPYGTSEYVDSKPLVVQLEPEFHDKLFAGRKERNIEEPCHLVPGTIKAEVYRQLTERAKSMNFSPSAHQGERGR